MSTMTRGSALVSTKIQRAHHERLAVVYVRQSRPQQLIRHPESTRGQYGLVDRALALGWPQAQVVVIDEDLGKSADSASERSGFQRLVAEVSLAHVGMILGLEMSRLARSNRDWHQLLEVCALFGTLLGDLDGIYDPTDYNDRLLLGLKGAMSEAELHVLKLRMQAGKRAKAARGELVMRVPMGYGRCSKGVDLVLDGYPKLVAIDEEPDHEIVHRRRLGKADRATDEPFNPRPQIDVFAFDFLCIGLTHLVLRGVNMALVGAPPIRVEAADPKRLQQRFELQKDGILPPPKHVR